MRDYASLEDAVGAIDPRFERPFRCHVHEDRTASASVNVAKGLWYCYACHAKGKVDGTLLDTDPERLKEDIFLLLDFEEVKVVPESMLELYRGPCEFWAERFSEAAVEHFKLGFDPVTDQPTYPVRKPSGELLGVVRRNLDGHPKYVYPLGIRKSELLFNYSYGVKDHVVLVEGAPDAIAAWEVGVEAFGIYGSHLSQKQLELVLKCSPKVVHTAFDNDPSGRLATEEATGMFEEHGIRVEPFDWKRFPFHKDVAELELDKRERALHGMIRV